MINAKLIGGLAFVTFLHLGARTAAPASVTYVSGFVTPAELPEELEELTAESESCSLLVVFDPLCPACDRAARTQAQFEGELPLDVVWVAESEEAAADYIDRVHQGARVAVSPEAAELLDVNGVPAAFVVAGDQVVYSAAINGQELLDQVAQRCVVDPVAGP